jgi:hypothetical protein
LPILTFGYFKTRHDGLLPQQPTNPTVTSSFKRISGAYIPRQQPQHQSQDSGISGVGLDRLQQHTIETKCSATQLTAAKHIPGANDIQTGGSLNMRNGQCGGRLRVINPTESHMLQAHDSDETRGGQQDTFSQNNESEGVSKLIDDISTLYQELEAAEGN